MLRMQNGIYERGSAAQQTATGASARAGPGHGPGAGRLPGHNLLFSQTKVGETSEVSHKWQVVSVNVGLAGSGPEPGHRCLCSSLPWAVGVRGSGQLKTAAGLQLAQLISISENRGCCVASF